MFVSSTLDCVQGLDSDLGSVFIGLDSPGSGSLSLDLYSITPGSGSLSLDLYSITPG